MVHPMWLESSGACWVWQPQQPLAVADEANVPHDALMSYGRGANGDGGGPCGR